MSDLETILRQFYGKHFLVFKKDGSFTKKGYDVYTNFCSFLYSLESIVPGLDADYIERELDKIAYSKV